MIGKYLCFLKWETFYFEGKSSILNRKSAVIVENGTSGALANRRAVEIRVCWSKVNASDEPLGGKEESGSFFFELGLTQFFVQTT